MEDICISYFLNIDYKIIHSFFVFLNKIGNDIGLFKNS